MKQHFLVFIYFLLPIAVNAQTKFSPEDIKEDLHTLRASLLASHYNAYAYITQETFETAYTNARNKIQEDSLSQLSTINLFQRFISVLECGHTNIDFPIKPYIEYAQNGGTLFPLELAFEEGKVWVRKNWSENETIAVGSEVLSINGLSTSEILSRIHPQIAAERSYLKNAKIELYTFPRYYWQVFGKQDDFEVEIYSKNTLQKHHLKSVAAIEGFELKREDFIDAQRKLSFFSSTAYLNPGGFGGDENQFQSFIDSAFVAIKSKKIKILIIDLRNNSGGNDSFSNYLVSYIARKPFQWNSSFSLKTSHILKEFTRNNMDTTQVYWQKILEHKDGEIYDYAFEDYLPQPKNKRFKGKVYVLINRQSHSQAAVTAAQIQDYKFGTIVGEESADYPSLYASIFHFTLPKTGIQVNVTKGYIVRVNGSKKEEGVIPDIFIKDHLLDEKDEILEDLLKRIGSKN